MLHLYQSNRLEYLAELMAAVTANDPLHNPLAAEEIVVQSQGMRRYLEHFLARKHGVAANLRFALPAGWTWRLMREHLDGVPELSPFAPDVLRWRLMRLFASAAFAEDAAFAALRGQLQPYLGNGAFAAYQLAGQLADVFDHYLVYRPDWIEAWREGRTVAGLHEDQLWQAQLWRQLDDGTQPHRVLLWQQLLARLGTGRLPQRLSVFGIATLAPMYLQLLLHVAEHADVYVFALNPSRGYWGDAVEAQTILRQAGEPDLSRQGHPLLASLGKQGRDFFDALAEAPLAADHAVFDDEAASPALLHTLQHHIQQQILPADASAQWLAEHGAWLAQRGTHAQGAVAQITADPSVEIHSAHSPLRELQILKDRILAWLDAHRDWQPHDIAVLTPDIAPYAPFVEGVFGGSADGRVLPYSLSDVRLSRRQTLLYALEQALSLLAGRFETDKLLPLLDNEAVQRRFAIGREDLPLLHDTVARLNIHWGADAAQRAEHGGGGGLFTWQQGLERLVLGWALPENGGLWHQMSAWHTAPDHTAVLARFAALVRLLSDTRRLWQTPATVAQWAERMRVLAQDLCEASAEDGDAAAQLAQALSDWTAQAACADFGQTVAIETACAHMRRFLGSQSDAGFLRGGITFCSMVPMRSLPFKAVCLLGLNDGQFPRNTKAVPFDLIAKHPQKGDRARRDDDRYLFLEALLGAREILYLSYVGRSIRTNDALAPSVLLYELADTVAALGGTTTAELLPHWVVQHPLQGFSPRYFNGTPRLAGSRSDYADALNRTPAPAAAFADACHDGETPDNGTVAQADFVRFWRNPLRSYLKNRLDWQAPRHDAAWDAAEPFVPSQPRLLESAYVRAREQGRDFDRLADELAAQSLMPAGKLGELTRRDYAVRTAALDGTLLHSPPLPEQSGVWTGASGALAYRLPHCRQAGQILTADDLPRPHRQDGGLSFADRIELLLYHLIYCAAVDEAQASHYVSLSAPVALPPLDAAAARAALDVWLSAYRAGQNAPLPFFPRMSLRAAAKLPDWAAAEAEAAKIYHGGYHGFAQADYPEVRLVYGRDPEAEPPYRLPAFRHLTENLFAPLQNCVAALCEQDDKAHTR
ncbi:exodeoxyribonuclease V subunit gamma [Conchiformibius kuhniae]|uniref:RecBCD enzyme subunit RecC n=1 Tax=Conchiformibius kuhniae TaxID=211502 RepID=A0ABD8B6P8_9NEIS|nr:exodeoxyribonuclease V subunit gamma [Conchiformibius kuhniae]